MNTVVTVALNCWLSISRRFKRDSIELRATGQVGPVVVCVSVWGGRDEMRLKPETVTKLFQDGDKTVYMIGME